MNDNGTSGQRGIVVVGVDASEGASAALKWAAAEARLRKTRLLAVYAWTFSYPRSAAYLGGAPGVGPAFEMSDLHRAAGQLLEHATAAMRDEADGVEIECDVIEGPAAEVLVGAVSERDLLVVGSRGHGGFVGLLLGSVSQQCAHHAPCPVVIVPAAAERSDPARATRTESGAAA